MKTSQLRRELRIPSLNLSDVGRGLDRLHGCGYLGTGPAHAWSSAAVPGGRVAQSAGVAAATAAAKRAVDLAFRKRAMEFDQLVPLLLDPTRYIANRATGGMVDGDLVACVCMDDFVVTVLSLPLRLLTFVGVRFCGLWVLLLLIKDGIIYYFPLASLTWNNLICGLR